MSIPAKLMCSSVFLLFVGICYAGSLPDDWERKDITLIGALIGQLAIGSLVTLIVSIIWEIWTL